MAPGTFQSVGQRQEGEHHVVVIEMDRAWNDFKIGHDIAVRQHHTLGVPRRARGVNQRGQCIPAYPGQLSIQPCSQSVLAGL